MYDRPSLSIFAVIACLQRNYAEALSRSDVKAIVLTGIFWKKRSYSRASHAGAVFQVFSHVMQVPRGGFAADLI